MSCAGLAPPRSTPSNRAACSGSRIRKAAKRKAPPTFLPPRGGCSAMSSARLRGRPVTRPLPSSRSTTTGPRSASSAFSRPTWEKTRILAVADEVDESLYGDRLPRLNPDLVLGCGDLPFDYLEYLVSRLDVPLLYVPGNHDASLQMPDMTWMPLRSELRPMPGP